MEISSEAQRQLLAVRQSLHSAIVEHGASTDELKAAMRELEDLLQHLNLRGHLRAAGESTTVRDGNTAAVAVTEKMSAGLHQSISQLQREADRALQRGRESVLESTSLRFHSRQLRSVIHSEGAPYAGGAPDTADRHDSAKNRGGTLSKRERQVLDLIVQGKSSKEIAAALGISFKTAVTHRASIMGKLDVHEIASLVREAIWRGLV